MPPSYQPAHFSLFAAHVSRSTSEHESATAEQRRYRAALISALLKPAAILKLFLCVSLSLPPSSVLSNILPLPLPPSPCFPRCLRVTASLCFPLLSPCVSSDWLHNTHQLFMAALSVSQAKPITDGVIANGLLLYLPPALLHSSNKYPRDNERETGISCKKKGNFNALTATRRRTRGGQEEDTHLWTEKKKGTYRHKIRSRLLQ